MQNVEDKIISLNKISDRFFEEEEKIFANLMLDTAKSYRLPVDFLPIAFLINSDLKKEALKAEIAKDFGSKTVQNLELLTRISQISFPETQRQIEQLRKTFVALTDDLVLIIIKLIERFISLKQADSIPQEKAVKLAEECLYLYSPIAHRLGISKLYGPMEDIAFKYLYPDDFRKIRKAIEIKRESFERKLKTMSHNLMQLLGKQKISAQILHRVKRPYSIYRKLKAKNIGLEEIYDLLALRVVTNSEEHCYLTLGIVHSNWLPIDNRFRDWITFPKSNGYRSIQTTISTRSGEKYEIQIRTEEMNLEAEYGSAAHWAYKEGKATSDKSWTQKLKEFLDNDEYFENPVELFEMLKTEMKSDHIHVLTPKGEIVSLVENATPIDFAFAVHTDLGYKVTGARVNGKFAKLKTNLKSGDVVEIISSKNGKPSRDWLDFVRSTRSRSKILRWFKNNERNVLIIDGKKGWERLKKQYKNKLAGFDDETNFKNGLAKNSFQTADDFYWGIANSHVKLTLTLLKKMYPKAFEKIKVESEKERNTKLVNRAPQVRVEGLSDIVTKIAKCCHPIKGEDIFAYVTSKSEIKIHRKDCPYINRETADLSNIKKAEWLGRESLQMVRLKIFGPDYLKLLVAFANEAADNGLTVIKNEKQYVGKKSEALYIEMEIKDIEQLRRFTNKLRTLPDIDSIKIL